MKLALIGYGKMGKAIEAIATERGHSIVAKIDNESDWQTQETMLKSCDAALEFTTPATAVDNIRRCLQMGLRTIVGTTGWYEHQAEMESLCKAQGGALFVASNFSIGMNIMMAMNRKLAEIMNHRPEYSISISETHHIHKLDAPSGTAIQLAKECIANLDGKSEWKLINDNDNEDDNGLTQADLMNTDNADETDVSRRRSNGLNGSCTGGVDDDCAIPIRAYREGENPGEHQVKYDSEMDTIVLEHKAKSRKGLALGAVLAAEFLEGKVGVYSMRDLLGI